MIDIPTVFIKKIPAFQLGLRFYIELDDVPFHIVFIYLHAASSFNKSVEEIFILEKGD